MLMGCVENNSDLVRAAKAAMDGWKARIRREIKYCATYRSNFTCEDVVRVVGKPFASGNPKNCAIGGLFSAAVSKGTIKEVGHRTSVHGSRIAVWSGA